MSMEQTCGWIGVDLDGTLAEYDHEDVFPAIGAPIPAMVARVKEWLSRGQRVKIMTARAGRYDGRNEAILAVMEWTEMHIGTRLDVTNEKDYQMIELWDDRAVRVEANTGRRLSPSIMEF